MRVRHIELHWGSEVNSQCPLFCLQEVNHHHSCPATSSSNHRYPATSLSNHRCCILSQRVDLFVQLQHWALLFWCQEKLCLFGWRQTLLLSDHQPGLEHKAETVSGLLYIQLLIKPPFTQPPSCGDKPQQHHAQSYSSIMTALTVTHVHTCAHTHKTPLITVYPSTLQRKAMLLHDYSDLYQSKTNYYQPWLLDLFTLGSNIKH